MKRSLKTLAACAAFTICMCATMIVSFAATDLKIDPVALMAYAQDASSEEGVSITGGELFIGLDTGSYTFADVADSLNDYGLAYEVTDDAYVIGGAVEIGTAGAFTDALAADASYKYNVVGDGSQAVIVTIAAKNAEEVASVVVAGVSDVAQDVAENGLPEEVTDTITDIYNGIADVVPDVISNIQEQAPVIVSGIVDTVTENYSDVIDQATEALSNISPDDVQDFVDTTVSDIADTVGGVINDVAGAIGDAASDINFDDLWAFLFS